jgi:PleD family two-component response regulator
VHERKRTDNLYLKRRNLEIISEQIKTSSVSVGAEGTRLGQKAASTILVVEDIAEIALHMKRRLMERGHRVIWTQDPGDAIEIAEQNCPSIILTDLELPKLELLLDLVSNHAHLSKLPVAAIDLNHLDSTDGRVKILPDFDALEEFVLAL